MPPRRTASRSASRASPRGRRTSLSTDELDYLSPDFDAGTLTKPRLRTLLAEHGVALPPPSARKDVLLGLFETHIRPLGAARTLAPTVKAESLLSSPRIKAYGTPSTLVEKSTSRVARGRSRAPRASRSPVKTGRSVSRTGSRKSAKIEAAVAPDRQQTTQVEATHITIPVTIRDSVEESLMSSPSRRRRHSRSPQSSSVVVGNRSPLRSKAEGREVSPHVNVPPKSGSIKGAILSGHVNDRQRTPSPRKSKASPKSAHDEPTQSRRRSSISRSPPKGQTTPPARGATRLAEMLPTAADTPRSATTKLYGCLSAAAESAPSGKHIWHRILIVVSMVLIAIPMLAALAYGILKTSVSLPYCSSCALQALEPTVLSTLDSALCRGCIPCPPHGRCTDGRLLCPEGRVARTHWLALGSSCVPDAALLSLVEDTGRELLRVLGERYASAACAGRLGEGAHSVSEAELADALYARRPWRRQPIVRGHAFAPVFRAALADVRSRSHAIGLVAKASPVDGSLHLSVASAPLGLWCRARLSVSARWRRLRPILLPVAVLLAAGVLFVLRLRTRRRTAVAVDALVVTVLRILAEQAAAHAADARAQPGLSVAQMRDALFMGAGAGARTRLWPAVCRAVALNANVRESVMSVRGEAHRVWEWIGPGVLAPRTPGALD